MIDYTLPTGFNGCEHPSINLGGTVRSYHDPSTDLGIAYAAYFTAHCPDCGVKFRFLGDNGLAPLNITEAQQSRRAWVSGTQDELGVMISPIEPGEVLGGVPVAGRA